MKKNMAKTIIFALILSSSQVMYAQSLTSSEERQLLMKIVELFEDYKRYSSMDEDFPEYSSAFRSLFVDGDALVYNDLLGIAEGEYLPVRDYVKLMSSQSRTSRTIIKNIDHKNFYQEAGKWKVDCSFEKYINLTSSCGVEYASDFFNDGDYEMLATIIYDSESNLCQFEKITGAAKPIRSLADDYRVLKSTSEKDKDVLYNGKPLEFNAMRQAFISPRGKFVYKDPEVAVKVIEDDSQCRLWHIKLTPKPWRIKARYNLGLGDAYKLDGINSMTVDKNSCNEFGLEFGYIIPSKSMVKTGLFMGVGFAQSKIDLSYANADYTYTTTADVDGDSYTRHYQNLIMKQSIKMTDFTIPLYVDFNFHFNKVVNLFIDLGAKFDMNMGHKIDTAEGKAYIYGIYSQYANLRMDEHWGYNGFGDRIFSSSNLDNADLVDVSSFTVDAFAGIGLRVNIPQTPLAIDLGVNYQMGLMDVVKANSAPVTLSGTPDATHALVYNTISGTDSKEHVRNLTESLSSIKRQRLMFSAGITLKF